MELVLVGTDAGCRTFCRTGELRVELSGRNVGALSPRDNGECLAIVDDKEIWRRDISGGWTHLATADISLQSITASGDLIFGGAMDEPAVLRISPKGDVVRLVGFNNTEGRAEWIANGPPLGVRAMTTTTDAKTTLAAVHVGGIPRSIDRGETWSPTIPIEFDVHDIEFHPISPNVVAAAAAVGLCLSLDGGISWTVFGNDFENLTSLAVAVLPDEVLFSVQDGPFASRSQVWRYVLGDGQIKQVTEGLPEWLEGKVDTNWIATGHGRAAIVDGGGNLWLSGEGSRDWVRIATCLPYVFGLALL